MTAETAAGLLHGIFLRLERERGPDGYTPQLVREHEARVRRVLEEYRREGMEAVRADCASVAEGLVAAGAKDPATVRRIVLATPLPGESEPT